MLPLKAVFSHGAEKEAEAFLLELLQHSSAPLFSTPPPYLHLIELGTTHFRWGYFDDRWILEQRVGLLIEMETGEKEETDKGRVGGSVGRQRMVSQQR